MERTPLRNSGIAIVPLAVVWFNSLLAPDLGFFLSRLPHCPRWGLYFGALS
jgi:hypothetical protein